MAGPLKKTNFFTAFALIIIVNCTQWKLARNQSPGSGTNGKKTTEKLFRFVKMLKLNFRCSDRIRIHDHILKTGSDLRLKTGTDKTLGSAILTFFGLVDNNFFYEWTLNV